MDHRRRWLGLVLALCLLHGIVIPLVTAYPALAAVDGSYWTVTGAISGARLYPAAALLPDGRVLLAGGQFDAGGTAFRATAETYDPFTGLWSPTGSMGYSRSRATATLLPNGKVLVVGGIGCSASGVCVPGYLPTAELYDPATGAWTATGSLTTARAEHTATLLLDGRVAIVGGRTSTLSYTASVEVYNPATGVFTTLGVLTVDRGRHTTTLLADGRLLVVAGQRQAATTVYLSSVELFDPTTGSSASAAPIGGARSGHTATMLRTGKVLVAGGRAADYLNTAAVYDPAANTWALTDNSLSVARASHTAVLLVAGQVLVIGGQTAAGGSVAVDFYNPLNNSWMGGANAELNSARYGHISVLLPNGRPLVVAGFDGTGYPLSTELYQMPGSEWTLSESLNDGRSDFTLTPLFDGRVLAAGGQYQSSSTVRASAELFTPIRGAWPVTGAWTLTGSMAAPRHKHTATLLRDGRVLVTGGYNPTDSHQASCELFNPATGTWSATGSMVTKRTGHSATLLSDGRVLVVGGYYFADGALQYPKSVEIYDPAAGSWILVANPMQSGRYEHTATLLADGRVAVFGGLPSSTMTHPLEIFNPQTGTWASFTGDSYRRYGHSATLLRDGTVLIVGGTVGTLPTREALLYTPGNNGWTAVGWLAEARSHHAAVMLHDGSVLVVGGLKEYPAYAIGSEIYNSVTRSWAAGPVPASGRAYGQAQFLADGRVLYAGGGGGTLADYTRTEVFDYIVGLAWSEDWRPVLSQITPRLATGQTFVASGSQLRSGTGASGGTTQDSSTGYPLMQIRRIDNGQVRWLSPQSFSDSGYVSRSVLGFSWGPAMVTAFVNGIPSASRVTDVGTYRAYLPLALRNP